MAFYPASFLAKTCQFFLLANDAPSMALLVLQDKMLRSLAGHVVPDTVKKRNVLQIGKKKKERLWLRKKVLLYINVPIALIRSRGGLDAARIAASGIPCRSALLTRMQRLLLWLWTGLP